MENKHSGTILVFVAVLMVLFLFNRNINLLYAALGFAAIGLLIPSLSRGIHWVWMKFAELLGGVMNKVILSLVFFIILMPVAFLSRLFRKDPLKSKRGQATSYFIDRNFLYTKKSLEELW